MKLKVSDITCNIEKRRLCDSMYKKRYERLLKSYELLLKELNTIKEELLQYKTVENLKGGE